MKKIIAFILAAALMCAAFTGCSGSDKKTENGGKTESAGKTAADIKAAGKLVIATSPDFPPFEELKSDGSVEGIEIDILNMICKELGVTLEIQQMDFESVLPGVQAGKFDLGVSGITANEERKKNALFTDPYCLAAQAIVVTASGSVKSKADLAGKAVAVQTGTTAESFCMSEGYKVNSYAANSDAELSLVNGKVDAWVIDDLTAAEMVASYNETHDDKLVILDEAMTTEPYGFATKLGNDDLIGEINKILKKLLDDGTIASVFEKFEAPYTKP